jgi:ribA/ribD-fused uncharacterized protein
MNIITFTKINLPYGWLGNMSRHPIDYDGNAYKTSEALFQCLRFEKYPNIQQIIIAQTSPISAKGVAKQHSHLQNKTNDLENMWLCLELKLQQHPSLVQQLLDTQDAVIIEDCTARYSKKDSYWGMCYIDGEWWGQNSLGKIWMSIREMLRNDPRSLDRLLEL